MGVGEGGTQKLGMTPPELGLRALPASHPDFLSSHPASTLRFPLRPLQTLFFCFLSTPPVFFKVQVNPLQAPLQTAPPRDPLGGAVRPQLMGHGKTVWPEALAK